MPFFHKANILIVDDDRMMRAIVEIIFRQHGIENIILATDGVEAFRKLEDFTPDLIILDVSMPNMDGFEFCSRLRKSNHPARGAQILVLTGLDNSDDRLRALHAGVSGMLHKNTLQTSLISVAHKFLQQAELLKILHSGVNIDASSFEQAQTLLQDLLPNDSLLQKVTTEQHIKINHLYHPSEALGGDYWFVQPVNSNRTAIFIADYSGHGVTATVNVFRLHSFMKNYARYHMPPAEILSDLNKYFYPMLPTGEYVVCFLGIIDTELRKIQYAASSLPPAILTENNQTTLLDCSGDVIGAYDDATYQTRELSYKPSSRLLLYSDALVESNEQGNYLFTQKTLMEAIQQNHDSIIENIKKSNYTFSDDLTVLDIYLP